MSSRRGEARLANCYAPFIYVDLLTVVTDVVLSVFCSLCVWPVGTPVRSAKTADLIEVPFEG